MYHSTSFIEWALFEIQWIVNFLRFGFNPLLLAWQIFNSFSPFSPILICYPNEIRTLHCTTTEYGKILFYFVLFTTFFSFFFSLLLQCIPFIKHYSQFFPVLEFHAKRIQFTEIHLFFSSLIVSFCPRICEMHFSCYCIRMYAECLFVCNVLKMFHMFWFHVHVKARKNHQRNDIQTFLYYFFLFFGK